MTCFQNREEKDDFIKDALQVRHTASNFYNLFYKGVINKTYVQKWKEVIFQETNNFIAKWEVEMVPIDIRKVTDNIII